MERLTDREWRALTSAVVQRQEALDQREWDREGARRESAALEEVLSKVGEVLAPLA